MSPIFPLQTPAALLDTEKLNANMARMADKAASLGVALRPHAKTPKTAPVVAMLPERGAKGVCVSTLQEAEYLLKHGVTDMLYAVPMDPNKTRRFCDIRARGAALIGVLDSVEAAEAVAEAIVEGASPLPFLVEIDVDGYRTGAQGEDALRAARYLSASPKLEMKGLMSYGGASYQASVAEAAALAERHRLALVSAKAALAREGVGCDIVSFGSGPAVLHAASLEGITECRCGIYLFGDLFQAGIGACSVSDIALSVLTSVIGKQPHYNRLIIDAGGMALSKDRSTQGKPFDAGYGLVCAENGDVIPDLYVAQVSQEIGLVTTKSGAAFDVEAYHIGQHLRILPNHSDMTAAAYPGYHVIRNGAYAGITWDRVNFW